MKTLNRFIQNRNLISNLTAGIVVFLLLMTITCAFGPRCRSYKDLEKPPPESPKHGYRYVHHGLTLIYDAGLEAYVVADYPDYYFKDGLFLRFKNGKWQSSEKICKGWNTLEESKIPESLKKTQ